jgi:hypothetical protein
MLEGGLVLYQTLFPAADDIGQLAVVLQALSVLLMVPKQAAASALPVLSRFAAAGAGQTQDSMQTMLRLILLGSAKIARVGAALATPLIGAGG